MTDQADIAVDVVPNGAEAGEAGATLTSSDLPGASAQLEALRAQLAAADPGAKVIGVVGGGPTGLITAATLQADGHNVVVFEAREELGGVWYTAYPGATLQNTRRQYYHPDFNYQTKGEYHPTKDEVQNYLKDMAKNFNIHVLLEHKVVRCEELAEHSGWTIFADTPAGQVVKQVDHLVVAQGFYTLPKVAAPWGEPPPTLKAQVITEREVHDLEMFRDKTVAVVGMGKTATDMARFAADRGAEVKHVFRTPRWMIPLSIMGLHFTFFTLNRVNAELMPCWDHASAMMRFVHKCSSCVISAIWWLIAKLIWATHNTNSWCKGKEAKCRMAIYKPPHGVLRDLRVAAALTPLGFFRHVVSGAIEPYHSEVVGYTDTGLELKDGRVVEADIIIIAIGSGDERIRYPFLPDNVREEIEALDAGVQLYRHVFHPKFPTISFSGLNNSFLVTVSTYLGALWNSMRIRGELQLPSDEEMLAAMARMAEWKGGHISAEPNLNTAVGTRFFHYHDVLCDDMRVPWRRKIPIWDYFVRYDADFYAGLNKKIRERREKARKRGKTVGPYKVMPRDM